jgi:uncharacterized protein
VLNEGPSLFFDGELNPEHPAMAAYFEVIKSGNIRAVFSSNAFSGQLMKMDFQFGVFSRGYLTFGFFLLGLVAGRLRLFQHYAAHRKLLKQLLIWSTVLFFVSLIFGILIFSSLGEGASFNSWLAMLGLTAFDLNNIAMTFLLLGFFVVLYKKDSARKILDGFAPYGRMALTNYVLQSVLGTFLFYGWGLGLVGELRNVYTFMLALFIIAFQMALSKWWLKHYHYGPFEWIWRSLTFLRLYPLKKELHPK